jgi:hypothetical protein
MSRHSSAWHRMHDAELPAAAERVKARAAVAVVDVAPAPEFCLAVQVEFALEDRSCRHKKRAADFRQTGSLD